MKLNNNDDSHNSGLNLLIYNMLLDIESHPTWVCGLKRLCFLPADEKGEHGYWFGFESEIQKASPVFKART